MSGTSNSKVPSVTTGGPTTCSSTSSAAPRSLGSFGLFGSTAGFGSNGNASSTAPTASPGSSLFGSTPTTTSIFGQPKSTTFFGSSPAAADPPPVTTGTSTRAYLPTAVKEIPGTRSYSQFTTITAIPTYTSTSLEELRTQDYHRGCKKADTSRPTSTAPAISTNLFGTPATTQQSTTGLSGSSIFNAVTMDSAVPNLPATVTSTTNTFGPPPGRVSDPSKLECMEELLRKSLLGEEVVNTQFHLFSAKSSTSGRVSKPRVLCANNALLAKSSKYFLDLLSSDINSSDPSLADLVGDNDVPDDAQVEEYGYESDSDLDECDDPVPTENSRTGKNQSATVSPIADTNARADGQAKDSNELADDGFESVGSNTFVEVPEQSSEDQTAVRLRSLGSRHILVTDTAFQTWYTLLNYLYTGKFGFLPLSSTASGRPRGFSSSLDGPKCSAKSMYRLASKVGLDRLRDEALAHIRKNLTEHNILKELSSRFLSMYPRLLEMVLDVLYSHIGSPPVVANFATLAQRIAHNELPHGAEIIVGIHTRLLKDRFSFSFRPTPTLSPSSLMPPTSVKRETVPLVVPKPDAEPTAGVPRIGEGDPLPSGSSKSPSAASQASTSAAMPTFT